MSNAHGDLPPAPKPRKKYDSSNRQKRGEGYCYDFEHGPGAVLKCAMLIKIEHKIGYNRHAGLKAKIYTQDVFREVCAYLEKRFPYEYADWAYHREFKQGFARSHKDWHKPILDRVHKAIRYSNKRKGIARVGNGSDEHPDKKIGTEIYEVYRELNAVLSKELTGVYN